MAPCDHIFELHLHHDLSELGQLDTWLGTVSEKLKLDEAATHSLQLCVIEAVTNVIVHNSDEVDDSDIALAIEDLDGVVTVTVCDAGRPFDPTSFIVPPKPSSLRDTPIGGHGIRLIREFTTTLGYQRTDGRNMLSLSFAR